MVYIFGSINFPVLEVLLTVTLIFLLGWVILVMGIYYILKELRAFRTLASHERIDIKELEEDIADLQ